MGRETINRLTAFLANKSEKLCFMRGSLRLFLLWPVAALLLTGVGWTVLLSHLADQRHHAEETALREAASLARNYAEQVTRTIEAIDQITLYVKQGWQVSGQKIRLEGLMQERILPSQPFFNVAVVNRDGDVVTSTTPSSSPSNIQDRPHFLMQKNAQEERLYISTPAASRESDKPLIYFSRRLSGADGSFDGIVLVVVPTEYLTASYDETSLGKNGFLGVVGSDNVLRAARIGSPNRAPDLQALKTIPSLEATSGTALFSGDARYYDERSRYTGWQAVQGYPLLAVAALDQEEKLAPYWARRAAALRQAIWATAAIMMFKFIAMGLTARLAWRKHQAEMAQATYRMATEEGSEGFYIARPVRAKNGEIIDFVAVDCNQRGAELFRLRRNELIGKRVSTLYNGRDPRRLMEAMSRALQTGSYESEMEVTAEGLLTTRWLHLKIVKANDELAIRLRDISDSKAHVEELERRANEDELTGLPNRHWVQHYLPGAITEARVRGSHLALLFLDLDGFKSVNDTMGHVAGDELLRTAAKRLKLAVRPHDYVARLGGDEFVVVLDNVEHNRDAAHVAERILDAFREGFRLMQGMPSLGVSIGISIFPNDGEDAGTLLKNADIAMYSVKTSGKGDYRFYDERYYEALRSRIERESELRAAIERDEFVMYYQPRVEISTGATCSMEALVRWQHPTKGLIEPLEFIPLAEETGMIIRLGELAIEKVCAQLAAWQRQGERIAPVSVNVSPRQFNETDIAALLSNALARHHIDPAMIEIELTESSMMGDSAEIASTLTAIQRMGIKLLVDDFGTGYSSLSQLQRLDFDVLKVDRSFTSQLDKNEEGHVFFSAIITMAHALGMRVVAEGVESLNQIAILKKLRCDEIQGFYVSRPLPASQTVLLQKSFPVLA